MKRINVLASAASVAFASLLIGGCVADKPDIPEEAILRTEGQQNVSFMAPSEGMVYVYDSSSNRLVYSGRMEEGSTIRVDPDNGRIMLGSQLASEKSIIRGNNFRIYFEPDTTHVKVYREKHY